jgi:ankyrin repeat protein
MNGNIDLIKEMIAKGEKVNIQDTYGRTCLHHSN